MESNLARRRLCVSVCVCVCTVALAFARLLAACRPTTIITITITIMPALEMRKNCTTSLGTARAARKTLFSFSFCFTGYK